MHVEERLVYQGIARKLYLQNVHYDICLPHHSNPPNSGIDRMMMYIEYSFHLYIYAKNQIYHINYTRLISLCQIFMSKINSTRGV